MELRIVTVWFPAGTTPVTGGTSRGSEDTKVRTLSEGLGPTHSEAVGSVGAPTPPAALSSQAPWTAPPDRPHPLPPGGKGLSCCSPRAAFQLRPESRDGPRVRATTYSGTCGNHSSPGAQVCPRPIPALPSGSERPQESRWLNSAWNVLVSRPSLLSGSSLIWPV